MLENFPTKTKEQHNKMAMAKDLFLATYSITKKIKDEYGGDDRAKMLVILVTVLAVELEIMPEKFKETLENSRPDDDESIAIRDAFLNTFIAKP